MYVRSCVLWKVQELKLGSAGLGHAVFVGVGVQEGGLGMDYDHGLCVVDGVALFGFNEGF